MRVLVLLVSALLSVEAFGATYYVAPGGNDSGPGSLASPWATIQKAATTLVAGDIAYIRSGTYHEWVQVANSGSAGAEITFAAYPGESPVLDGTGVSLPDDLHGLFEVVLRSYIRVRGLRVQNVGPYSQNAGFLVESSQNVVLEQNVTDTTASSGIGVWGSQNVTLDGNEVIRACSGGQQEQISIGGTTGFTVVNNLVHDMGGTLNGGEGICLKDGSSAGLVRGNEVWNVPNKLGIYLDAWDKHTYDITVDANIVHHCTDGIVFAAENGGAALLENIRVTNNVTYANLYSGILVSTNGTAATHPMNNLFIGNNTVVGNGTSGWGGGIAIDSLEAQNVVVRNNVVSGNQSFTILVAGGVPLVTIDHNLVHGFMGDPNETRGTDYVEADPLFVSAGTNDYHLAAGSPAIDAGSGTNGPATDHDGTARPQGAAYDIGAFERAAAPAAASFHTLPPCRVLDTRGTDGPLGGPALAASATRSFTVAGVCGVPSSARSVSANVTVTQPAAQGNLNVYAADLAPPLASTIDFRPAITRANNARLGLSSSGAVAVANGSAGTVHFILDVNGYFQ